MTEGGWCWFQDPRAIIHNKKLVIGSVQGNQSGHAWVGVYDLQSKKQVSKSVVHEKFDRDDHNSPVFYSRSDGSILTVYARHGRDKAHLYRISEIDNPLKWGEEKKYIHNYPNAGTVTYMNLYLVGKENKLYNFFRGINYNPSYMTSLDEGLTWGEPTHFIKSDLKGRHRPYARYCGDGLETIHVSFTDGHPDQYGNSIYYAAFRNGNFYKANGEKIKSLRTQGPLRTKEAERVFKGSEKWAPPGRASASGSAWTSSIALDKNNYPHIAYSLHISNEDHRYRIASWTGTQWIDREVAFAGHCLYSTQTSYTGLISLDPKDPEVAVISSNVDPQTGKIKTGNYEIYRARIGLHHNSSAINWKPLTKNSPVKNIRPLILREGNLRVILWNRGKYTSYTNYQLDTVGVIEELE